MANAQRIDMQQTPQKTPHYRPPVPSDAGVQAVDAAVWQHPWQTVAVVGASKNAGKTTALNALTAAVLLRGERAGLCSIGVDGEASDVWLATAKPGVRVEKGTLVVTAQAAVESSRGVLKTLKPLDFVTSLGPTVLAEARAPGEVLLCGVTHRRQVETAIATLREAGAHRVLVDGAYQRQAVADAAGVQALVLAVGALATLQEALATLLALTTPPDRAEPHTLAVTGGLTDARLHQLNLQEIQVLCAQSQGAVLLTAEGHARLRRLGIRLTARHTLPLALVTANPHVPLGDDRQPLEFLQEATTWLHNLGLQLPLVDVVSGLQLMET